MLLALFGFLASIVAVTWDLRMKGLDLEGLDTTETQGLVFGSPGDKATMMPATFRATFGYAAALVTIGNLLFGTAWSYRQHRPTVAWLKAESTYRRRIRNLAKAQARMKRTRNALTIGLLAANIMVGLSDRANAADCDAGTVLAFIDTTTTFDDVDRQIIMPAIEVMATSLKPNQRMAATLANRDRQLAEADQELTSAQAETADTRQQLAQLAIDRRDLETQLAGLQQQRRWPSQVAEYHQYFATQPPRRWAEVSSKDQGAIKQYLADLGRDLGLDRPVPLPSAITEAGLKFVGGRTLVINGMPVAQLGYMDRQKRLLAFCFMRNPGGEIEPIRPSRTGDLRMLAWRDASFQYVVIGYESIGLLGKITGQLQRGYDLET
ncbi:MAG: hypothetical protein ACR2Q4_14325 [Geminicoccaceae bacterium]